MTSELHDILGIVFPDERIQMLALAELSFPWDYVEHGFLVEPHLRFVSRLMLIDRLEEAWLKAATDRLNEGEFWFDQEEGVRSA